MFSSPLILVRDIEKKNAALVPMAAFSLLVSWTHFRFFFGNMLEIAWLTYQVLWEPA